MYTYIHIYILVYTYTFIFTSACHDYTSVSPKMACGSNWNNLNCQFLHLKNSRTAIRYSNWGFIFDWCCFYYFARHSLVALPEALCDRIFFFRFVNIEFFCARSLTKPFLRPSQPGFCAWLSPFLLCADCTCVLVCVCLRMCMWKCVGKVINI